MIDTPKRLSDDAVAAIIQNEMGRYLSVDKDGEIDGTGPASYSAARLILGRLSTPPSQGKVERACCEGMREAAAAHVLSLRELGGIGGYNTALEYAAKQIRALPLPVSADETTTRLERHYPSFGNVEICCCGLLMKGHPPREPLKSKQPSDTGAGK